MNIQILPCFSLEPNKFTTFQRVFYPEKQQTVLKEAAKVKSCVNDLIQLDFFQDATPNKLNLINPLLKHTEIRENNNIKRKFHNFTISDNAYRTLKRKINWLYYMAKTKDITTISGKRIYNFKLSFLTLTLPAKQKTNSQTITNDLFNQFLTELRTRLKMQNYVWRLEFQKNGNVHYHIVTDCYVDYFFALKIWNRIIEQHFYVSDYHNKFKGLSLAEYNKTVNSSGATDFNVIAKRFAFGKKHNWKQPNTVDVKSVTNQKKIANYISKYFGKNADNSSVCNSFDNAENSKNMRLWFCSRGLSKLNSITDFSEAFHIDLFAVVSSITKIKKVFTRWCNLIYFDFKECTQEVNVLLHKLLKSYAFGLGYVPT